MACRTINYFPPSLQSCVTEAKAIGTLKGALWDCAHPPAAPQQQCPGQGHKWSALIWALPPHFLREILRDSKPEMTSDSPDKLLPPVKWWKHCHKIHLKVHVNVFLSTLRTSQAFQFSSLTPKFKRQFYMLSRLRKNLNSNLLKLENVHTQIQKSYFVST